MKKTIIILVALLLLGFFLFTSNQFEKKNKAGEIKLYECTSQFPRIIYDENKLTGRQVIRKVRLNERNMSVHLTGGAIPDDFFKNTPCVQEVWGSNQLSIPLAIKNLPQLSRLSLNESDIRTIPDTIFKHNKLLTAVDLSFNQITIFNLNIFKSVRQLELNHNRIATVLPMQGEEINYMHSLNLSENELTRFPVEILALQELAQLNLKENQIGLDPNLNDLPFEKLTMLTELDLSLNQIKQFPKRLGKIPHLTHLNLIGNQISGSVVFNGFKELTTLKIGIQLIENFTLEAGALPLLSTLNLSNNQIRTFEIKGNNSQLQQLELKNNRLSVVPSSINKLSGLTHLNLSSNKIKRLPDLSSINNLSVLNLAYNPISVLDFNRINPSITKLLLSYCNISSIKNLKSCPELKILDLNGNSNLKRFPIEIFDYLPNLEKLNIENTNFDSRTRSKIAKITREKKIFLSY